MRKQLACILGRQQINFVFPDMDDLDDEQKELMDLIRNEPLNTQFLNLAREVGSLSI